MSEGCKIPIFARQEGIQVPYAKNAFVDGEKYRRSEQLHVQQARLLELIATGTPLEECLAALCEAIPRLNPGVRASILLADEARKAFQRPIAPGLLASFGQGLEGAPINDLMIGTCGEAVFRDTTVLCADVAKDDRWSKEWRDLCISNGVRAGYSTPIRDAEGIPRGSFFLCFDTPRVPNEWEQRLAGFGTHIASIAIEREQSSRALRESEERLRKVNKTLEERVEVRTMELEQVNATLLDEIDERLDADEALAEANSALKESNHELENFAQVASHDLQEPLRKIRMFVDLLRQDCDDALSETGRDYMGRMENAALRMSTLIDDVLAFSRVKSQEAVYRKVDLDDIVAGVISDLELAITEAEGTVEAEPLPSVEMDDAQARQIFQNLISNAIKFHRPDAPPVIRIRTISVETDANMCHIAVEDNGIGIKKEHLERIFSPFQRLHGRSRYSGSGIGLAICRRIAERHGGSIKVESAPGEGSCFIVSLPVRQGR